MGFVRTVSTSSDGADREAAEVRLAEALVLALRGGKAAADLAQLLEQHGSPVHVRSAALPQGRWKTAVSTRSLPGSLTTSSSSVAEQICPRLTSFWRARRSIAVLDSSQDYFVAWRGLAQRPDVVVRAATEARQWREEEAAHCLAAAAKSRFAGLAILRARRKGLASLGSSLERHERCTTLP